VVTQNKQIPKIKN